MGRPKNGYCLIHPCAAATAHCNRLSSVPWTSTTSNSSPPSHQQKHRFDNVQSKKMTVRTVGLLWVYLWSTQPLGFVYYLLIVARHYFVFPGNNYVCFKLTACLPVSSVYCSYISFLGVLSEKQTSNQQYACFFFS